MISNTPTLPKSKIDLSPKESIFAELVKMLGTEIKQNPKKYRPWKWDATQQCRKCGSSYHLQRHHIVYKPEICEYLCVKHHERITKLNTFASVIAHTNLKTKTKYTNKVRVVLWRWFLTHPWTKELTRQHILNILDGQVLITKARPLEGKSRVTLESASPKHTLMSSLYNTTSVDKTGGCVSGTLAATRRMNG